MATIFEGNWWNSNYKFARPITIDPIDGTIPAGHPIRVTMTVADSVSSGKVRSDLADIEIVRQNSENSWSVTPSLATSDGTTLTIKFKNIADIAALNTEYYIFYGNVNLTSPPTVDNFVDLDWPLTTGLNDAGISYTNPGEDWDSGVSTTQGAVVSFTGYARKLRLRVQKSSSSGIVNMKLDDLPWQEYDLYSESSIQGVLFEQTDLDSSLHRLQVQVTGQKSPAALNNQVQVYGFDWEKFVETTLGIEDVALVSWTSYIVGA